MTQTLYWNGTILTMEADYPQAQCILTENGRIKKLGTLEEVKKEMHPDAFLMDLKGSTLMPAFLDSHSHITALANTMSMLNLQSATDFSEIIKKLKEFIQKIPLQKGQWLIGFGYDHTALKEKQHPTKEILDQVSSTIPICITHASGHMAVFNTKALSLAEITAQTPNPQGGKIGRLSDGITPNGYLEENAFLSAVSAIPSLTMEEKINQLCLAQQEYLKYGITTVQDGLTKESDFALLKQTALEKKLIVDVVSYIDQKNNANLLTENPQYTKKYQNNLKIGGYKILLDGSPQGKTAWLSKPYENSSDGYCGYPIYEKNQIIQFIQDAHHHQTSLLAHCNGDAASEQYLSCFEEVFHSSPVEMRPVMIHAQTVRKDQLERMKKLKMIPSFFIAHVYQWGDIHLENLGEERAKAISPAGSASKIGLIYTFHQDTPVLPPDMMQTVWCAVNRITKNGVVLGEQEKISVYDALKAITIHAAYQYFEEDEKGSLKEGKKADFVLLSQNPLSIEPEKIREIQILATIKDGNIVYQNPAFNE